MKDYTTYLNSWTCHICRERRDDEFISAYKTDLSAEYDLPAGFVEQNVRYCNDNLKCIEAAKIKRLL